MQHICNYQQKSIYYKILSQSDWLEKLTNLQQVAITFKYILNWITLSNSDNFDICNVVKSNVYFQNKYYRQRTHTYTDSHIKYIIM